MLDDGLVLRVARDFLMPGTTEPVAFDRLAEEAIAEAIELARGLGILESGVDDLLLFAYDLEGSGDSPAAAKTLRSLVGKACPNTAIRELEQRGKRLARARDSARAQPKRAGEFERRWA